MQSILQSELSINVALHYLVTFWDQEKQADVLYKLFNTEQVSSHGMS